MLQELKDSKVTWGSISQDVQDFLCGCLCAVTKSNKRRVGWKSSPDADFAVDLYTFRKTYLTILNLKTDEIYALEVQNKSSDEISSVFLGWMNSVGAVHSITVLSDRGGEFAQFKDLVSKHLQTASFSPQANGKIERKHKELSALCRLYDCSPPEACELLNRGRIDAVLVNAVKLLPNPGDLILRYVQKMGTNKTADPWTGPYLVQEVMGARVVRALNLDTFKESYIHLSDLKIYTRPPTQSWRLNPVILNGVCNELDVNFGDFQDIRMQDSWKGKCVFVDINQSADLEEILLKAVKDLPKKLLVLLPEWKERSFWSTHEGIVGDQVSLPLDEDVFLADGEPAGFRLWNCWVGLFDRKALVEAAANKVVPDVNHEDLGELLSYKGQPEEEDLQDIPGIVEDQS